MQLLERTHHRGTSDAPGICHQLQLRGVSCMAGHPALNAIGGDKVGAAHARHAPVTVSRRRRISPQQPRSEEQTSELQSLMSISYAVFCLKKKKKKTTTSQL